MSTKNSLRIIFTVFSLMLGGCKAGIDTKSGEAVLSTGSGAGQDSLNSLPVVEDFTPVAALEGDQAVIILPYSSSEDATSCAVSNLNSLEVVSECKCDSGECSVEIKLTSEDSSSASFDYTVTVEGKTSEPATATIDIPSTPSPPLGADKVVTATKNTQYVFSTSDFDFTDADGDTLASIKVTSLESVGSLKLNGSDVTLNQIITKSSLEANELTFDPAINAIANSYDSFEFSVNDGSLDSIKSYVMTIDVIDFNNAPTASNNTLSTNEDVAITFASADFNFSDIDAADTLNSVKITSLESSGSLALNGSAVILNQIISKTDIDAGLFTFTPDTNSNGAGNATFQFSVNDGKDDSSASYTITIDVTAINDAPTASNSTLTVNEDTQLTIVASDFDYADIEGSALTSVKITTLESVGSLKLNGADVTLNQVISKADLDANLLTFDAAVNANGTSYDSFGFAVNDGTDDSAASYTLTIDVTAVNDLPTASNSTLTVNEDTQLTIVASDFGYADTEGSALTSVKITSLESVGALKLNGSDVTLNQVISKADLDANLLTFDAAANANGASYDSFGFTVNDGTDDSAAGYTITIDVTAVNDAPTSANNTISVNEDNQVIIATSDFSYSDVESSPLASIKITQLESSGVLKLNGINVTLNQVITKSELDSNLLTFDPIPNANGTSYDSFQFSVNDGTIDSVATYSMTIDVTPVNDAPSIAYLSSANLTGLTGDGSVGTPYDFTIVENTTNGEVSFTISDIDGDSPSIVCASAPAWVNIDNANDKITFSPSSASTDNNFSCVANDATVDSSETIYFSIDVIVDPFIVHLNASDLNGDGTANSGSIATDTTATWGDIRGGNNNGTLTNFTLPSDADSGWMGDGSVADPYRLQFDGTNDTVSLGSISNVNTFMIWTKFDTLTQSYPLFCSTGMQLRFDGYDLRVKLSSADSLTHSFAIDTNWHHFAVVADGSKHSFYMDGKLLVSRTTTSNSLSLSSCFLGSSFGTSYYFDGSISSLRVYTTSQSSSEVAQIYAEEKAQFTTDPSATVISEVYPGSGSQSGGETVYIHGWGLSGITDVSFGGSLGTSLTVHSDTLLSVVTPTGSGRVNVIVSGGGSDTASNAYRYDEFGESSNFLVSLTPENIDRKGTDPSTSSGENIWHSERGNSMNLSNINHDATSGWAGDGSVSDPYHIKFDGVDDFARYGQTFEAKTMSLWFNLYSDAASKNLVSCSTHIEVKSFYKGIQVQFYSTSTAFMVPELNRWHHLVAVNDGTNHSFYLDGKLIRRLAKTYFTSASHCVLGAQYTGATNFINSGVASFEIHGSALSHDEVAKKYAFEKHKFIVDPGVRTISELDPAVGSTAGGETIYIKGWGLSNLTSVTIGGVAATSLNILSDEVVSVVAPAGSAGFSDVVVTDSGGSTTAFGAYRYSAVQVANLTLALNARNIDSAGTEANSSITETYWNSELGSPGALKDFDYAGGSGWDGTGGAADPHRLKFDGVNDTVVVAGTHNPKTLAIWFNATSFAANQDIFGCNGNTRVYLDGTNIRAVHYSYHATLGGSPATWHHVIVTHDGTEQRFYLDGVKIETSASAATLSYTYNCFLGSNGGSTKFFTGSVGEVSIYDTPFTDTDATNLFNETKASYLP